MRKWAKSLTEFLDLGHMATVLLKKQEDILFSCQNVICLMIMLTKYVYTLGHKSRISEVCDYVILSVVCGVN